MHITQLSVQNFRNLENMKMTLNPNVNIIYGDNAQGKSNILESIYVCATGRSHRTHNEKELIQFGMSEGHIQMTVSNDSEDMHNRIDVHLKRDAKKGMAVNHVPIKKIGDLFGICHLVLFSPEDLNLIVAGPTERRKFLDMELCQLSNVYYYNLKQYYKILRQRNNLLKTLKTEQRNKDTIFVWDEQLVQYGLNLIRVRDEFVDKINIAASHIHKEVTGGKEKLTIVYKKSVHEKDFYSKLKKNTERDIFLGSTSTGPHKDDLSFFINDIDVRSFGSQGQKRTAALATKLAEIELIKEEKSVTPILLLDDVLSELDESRQNFLIDTIQTMQTIITCTGIEDAIQKLIGQGNIYKVKSGFITTKN